MTTQSAIDLLEPATAFRLAGKYARQAQPPGGPIVWAQVNSMPAVIDGGVF